MSSKRDSTCQKHEPPRSLRDNEDAELVWSLVTERFPRAAPLLCEMETVIERAEDLLGRLREPYTREIEALTSFRARDSEESVPLMSARGSFTDSDASEEKEKCVAETQVSVSSVYRARVDSNSRSPSPPSESCDVDVSQDRSDDLSSLRRSTVAMNLDVTSKLPHSLSYNLEDRSSKTFEESSSSGKLEETIDRGLGDSNGDFVSANEASFRSFSTNEELTVGDVDGAAEQLTNFESKYADENTVEGLPGNTNEVREGDASDRRKKNTEDPESKSKRGPSNTPLQGSGDENPSKFLGNRIPLVILEEYAKRCDVPIVYQNVTDGSRRYKTNFVVRGNLGGFIATCCGDNEEVAKNGVATKILAMLADRQTSDEKCVLPELSRDEMCEVIDLDTEETRQSAQRKLYRLCLERNQSVPTYSIDRLKTCQGITYVATCNALGHTGEGRGVRECVAKKAAAEEVYRGCCQEKSRFQDQ